MNHSVTVECPHYESFRTSQVRGMFDLKLGDKLSNTYDVELPDESEDWQIGVIVGASGSGKSSVARRAYGDRLYGERPWPREAAMIDGFPGSDRLSIHELTGALTSVGLSTAHSWCKPYHVLSGGERFRADLARALLDGEGLVAFDEYTSVVDRQVAKVGSAAVAKAIRSGRIKRRFVAVTCHYDVVEWLSPDWVLDMSTRTLTRGSVRRPDITFDVVPVTSAAWPCFAPHHYMSSDLHQSAQCYAAVMDGGRMVAICCMLYTFGWKDYWRVSRVVTLPDYQGVGIGSRLMDACCASYHRQGKRVSVVAAHPSILRYCQRSPRWRLSDVKRKGNKHQGKAKR